MFNFEKLHKTKKHAFADGLLTGLTVTYFVHRILKEKYENELEKARFQKFREGHNAGWNGGSDFAYRNAKTFVDVDRYEKYYGPYPA